MDGITLTQNIKVVGRLSPGMFREGIHTMIEKTQLDVSSVKCFFANIPTKHLMDLGIKELREGFQKSRHAILHQAQHKGISRGACHFDRP